MKHSMYMPASIPTEIKESVVQSWFCGLSRRPNAIKHNVSEGSVDNFVKDWQYPTWARWGVRTPEGPSCCYIKKWAFSPRLCSRTSDRYDNEEYRGI